MIITAEIIETLAKTIYGEARGESEEGQIAIACVIMNRTALAEKGKNTWWGRTPMEVCLKPWQFSCWNPNDVNKEKLERLSHSIKLVPFWQMAFKALMGFYERRDPTKGATHYHVKGCNPFWAQGKKPCARIGNHIFYKGID